jgi:hypothetical protein
MERIRLIAYRVKNSLSIRNSRFRHQFPPGYNRSILAKSSTPYPNVGEYKGSNGYHYRGLSQDKLWDTGQTKDNQQSRHHVYTTDYYYSMATSELP